MYQLSSQKLTVQQEIIIYRSHWLLQLFQVFLLLEPQQLYVATYGNKLLKIAGSQVGLIGPEDVLCRAEYSLHSCKARVDGVELAKKIHPCLSVVAGKDVLLDGGLVLDLLPVQCLDQSLMQLHLPPGYWSVIQEEVKIVIFLHHGPTDFFRKSYFDWTTRKDNKIPVLLCTPSSYLLSALPSTKICQGAPESGM